MARTYVTFGSAHRHEICGKVYDQDSVAIVDGDREEAVRIFGPKFCATYRDKKLFDETTEKFFFRGLIRVPADAPDFVAPPFTTLTS